MSQKELKNYDIIKKANNKEISSTEAARLLSITTRYVSRLKSRIKEKGAKGLVHASKGKISNRKIPELEEEKIDI